MTYNLRLAQALLIFLGCYLAGMAVGSAIWFAGGENLSVQKTAQGVMTLVGFGLPAVILARLWKSPLVLMHKVKYHVISQIKIYILVCLAVILLIPFINFTGWLNSQLTFPPFLSGLETALRNMEDTAQIQTETFLSVTGIGNLLFNLLIIALLPALCEEMFFRRTLQKLFCEKMNKHLAVWLAAAVFSIVHFQFFGFLPRLLLGALFGYLFLWSGNLWLPIMAHFTNNALATIFYYLKYNNVLTNFKIDSFGTENLWWQAVVSLIIAGVLIWTVRSYELKTKNRVLPLF